MELFKIFGTLALKGVDNVNRQLDDVSGKAGVDNKKLHTLFPAVYDRCSKVTQVGDFLKVKKYE